ncbi:phosphotransferase, partial [Pseudomonas aeruginosa]|uniref:phosphotransferase n=1 Tax=Pseudomonas aeruginosa TaxID=287 RepID=UPI0028848407
RAKQDILNLPVGKALIHGEPRVDNVLFEDLPCGPRAWLIDWQFASLGSPMFDLAYFLSGSLEPADRRAVEEGMIKAHQAAIAVCD